MNSCEVHLILKGSDIIIAYANATLAFEALKVLGDQYRLESLEVIHGEHICVDCGKLTFEHPFICAKCLDGRQGSS